MHHRMMNLPVSGTLGVAALLVLARLPIDLGVGPIPKSGRSWHLWQSKRPDFRVSRRPAGMNSPADAVLPRRL